jgi:uncharacterized protein YbjT (DUF2867 family)
MKVLVTGATGKVGSLLVTELIKRGADVRIFTRNQPSPKAVPKEVEVTAIYRSRFCDRTTSSRTTGN